MDPYELVELLGSGQFGMVYKGINKKTKEEVAIKIEDKKKTKLLKRESNIYLLLSKEDCFPRLKWYGSTEESYYMVMELLGVSLSELKARSDEIPIIIIKRLAKKMINLVEKVHKYHLLHRDIKPDNFLFDLKDYDKLYLIDFGLAKSYINNDDKHIAEQPITSCIGTQHFVSLNVHARKLPSRRDDIESVLYIICYLWIPKKKWIKDDHEENIQKFKISLPTLIDNEAIKTLFTTIKNISYDEEPCYEKIIEIIETI
jgi:serine/threonine protein kinase